MQGPLLKLLVLILLTASEAALSASFTDKNHVSIKYADKIGFDRLPLGLIEETAANNPSAINGVTYSTDKVTIDGVNFSNAGDTHYYPESIPFEELQIEENKTVKLRGLTVLGGETSWHFWVGPTIPPLPNQILLQGRSSGRPEQPVLDLPGRLNIIKIEFSQPVYAFGLTVGGNNPYQTLEIYDTDDQLIDTIERPVQIANFFTGYAVNSKFTDKKIKYLLWGNKHSHDNIYIEDLYYETFAFPHLKDYPLPTIGVFSILTLIALNRNRLKRFMKLPR